MDWEKMQAETRGKEDCARQNLEEFLVIETRGEIGGG